MRAVTYTRVSTDEQTGEDHYSLDAQARACRQYAHNQGWQIVREYVDEGKSARTGNIKKRPAFFQMLQDAEAHQFDVIIFHKLDRFSRNTHVTIETLERLKAARVGLVSVSEALDMSSPHGIAMLGILAIFAQLFSDNLSLETAKGKRERRTQGYYNGVIPFGYRRIDGRLIEPDDTTAPGLLFAFEQAAAGQSDREIAQALNDRGFRSSGNRGKNPWRKDSVRRMLLSRFYLGELPITAKKPGQKRSSTVGWIAGKHAALIDEELWARAQEERDSNRKNAATRAVNGVSTKYSLSGLLRCGHCGANIRIHRWPSSIHLTCYGRSQGDRCPQPSVLFHIVEAQVAAWLARLHIDERRIEDAIVELRQSEPTLITPEAERRRLQTRLGRLKDLYELGDIPRDEYLRRREALRQQLAQHVPIDRKRQRYYALVQRIKDVRGLWDAASQEERNGLLVVLVESIVLTDQAVTIKPQPDLGELLG